MKKIFSAILGTAMLFSAPVFADLEVPGETNPVLARETFKTGNLNLEIVKKNRAQNSNFAGENRRGQRLLGFSTSW